MSETIPQPDPRPRPQYGEYATPEEQRARIRQPDATFALDAGQALEETAPTFGEQSAANTAGIRSKAGSASIPGTGSPRSAAAPLSGARLADRVATIVLLALGLLNVTLAASALFAFERTANAYLALFGSEESFTNVAQGQLWGTIGGVLYLVGWVVTALLSWRRLRRRKIAFWIPLVGAIVTVLIVSQCISIPIAGDPAFAELLERLS